MAWPRALQKPLLKRADKCFLPSGQDRHAIVRELRRRIPPDPWKKKKKSASRCISYSPGNRTANLTPDCQWNNFGSEWLPPRSCESHTRPELFEPAGKRSSAELVETGGLWAAVIFLCFTPRSADNSLVCCTIIAHPVIPGFLVLAKKHSLFGPCYPWSREEQIQESAGLWGWAGSCGPTSVYCLRVF